MAFASATDWRTKFLACRNHSRGQLDRQWCLLRKRQARKDRIVKIRKGGLKQCMCRNVYVVLKRAWPVQIQYESYALMATAIEQTLHTNEG